MWAGASREGRGELAPSVTLREGVDCLDIRAGSSRLPPLIRARHRPAYAPHPRKKTLPARHPFRPNRFPHRFVTGPPLSQQEHSYVRTEAKSPRRYGAPLANIACGPRPLYTMTQMHGLPHPPARGRTDGGVGGRTGMHCFACRRRCARAGYMVQCRDAPVVQAARVQLTLPMAVCGGEKQGPTKGPHDCSRRAARLVRQKNTVGPACAVHSRGLEVYPAGDSNERSTGAQPFSFTPSANTYDKPRESASRPLSRMP